MGFLIIRDLNILSKKTLFRNVDFEIQKVFCDRVEVVKMLEEKGIHTPNHIINDRGDEINNDGESYNNLRELNTSAEKEKKETFIKKKLIV